MTTDREMQRIPCPNCGRNMVRERIRPDRCYVILCLDRWVMSEHVVQERDGETGEWIRNLAGEDG